LKIKKLEEIKRNGPRRWPNAISLIGITSPTVPTARKVRQIAFLHSIRVAWRSHPFRQAVHHKKPRIRLTLMRRLAVYSKLPCSF